MLLYDLVDLQELQGFVRQVQVEVERDTFTLQNFLRNNNIDDIEYSIRRSRRFDQDAATVRAWDSESPIAARRAEFERLVGELPPISRKIRLGEEERLRRRSLETGNNAQLVEAIYDDAANMARAVTARLELFRGEALSEGTLTIDENGVRQTVDFGRDPAADVTAGVLWSDPEAPVVTDLTNWVKDYRELNDGAAPQVGITDDETIGNLLFNEQIRNLVQVPEAAPQLVSQQAVANVLQAYGLPPLVSYETYVRVSGERVRVLPAGQVILVGGGIELGETLLGTTAEALELTGAQQLESDQAPGLVAVVEKTFDPVATWTKAAAIGLPVLYEPNRAFRAKVLA